MSNSLKLNRPIDRVPKNVYDKAKAIAAKAFEKLGAEPELAVKTANAAVDGVRYGRFEDIVLDDKRVSARFVFVDVDVSDITNYSEKVNIVTINGCKYDHSIQKSVFVAITETDAFLVACTCDNYCGFGENPEEFSKNHKYKKINIDDIPDVIEESSLTFKFSKR